MKRVLVVQDLFAIGKEGVNVSLPIFSSLGVETAICPVSINTGLDNSGAVATIPLNIISDFFKKNMIHFDCIFLGQSAFENNSDDLCDFINKIRSNDSLLVCDTFSRVNTLKENIFSPSIINLYKDSSVLITTLSDCFALFKNDDDFGTLDEFSKINCGARKEYIELISKKITDFFGHPVLLYDCVVNEEKKSIVYYDSRKDKFIWTFYKNLKNDFYGINNIFSAVFTGIYIKTFDLKLSVKLATDFLEKSIETTFSKPGANWYGTDFENVLHNLYETVSTLQLSDN